MAIVRGPKFAWFAISIFGVSFLLMSFAGSKATRYLSFAPPFLAIVWGIGLAATVTLVSVPPAAELDIQLDRDLLPADGISQAMGTIRARDLSGTDIVGKRIQLVAGERFDDLDANGVFTPGTDELLDDVNNDGTWTAIGQVEGEVFTNDLAEATFLYTAGETPGDVWIRAFADGISVDSKLELQDLPTAWSLELSSSKSI